MSQLQFIIILVLQVSMPIIITLCFKYLGAYSSKKGENQAIIEDNQKIISGIESIKLEFANLHESDRVQKNLTSQRLISHNSQKDDLLFQIFEDSDQLFNVLSSPDPSIVGFDKASQLAWADYYRSASNLMSAIIIKRSKLSVFFSSDEEILMYANQLIAPVIIANTALTNISAKISNMQSALLKESAYLYINGEVKVNDPKKMAVYLEQLHNLFIEQINFVYSHRSDFENAKQSYLLKVQGYYEDFRRQFNVR